MESTQNKDCKNCLGGGTDPLIMEQIRRMREQIDAFQEIVSQKLDADKIVNDGTVTEAGYAADARQLNASLDGTLARRISKTDADMRDRTWIRTPITSFSPGIVMANEPDGVCCLKNAAGVKRINGLLYVEEGFSLTNGVLFTVPEGFEYKGQQQGWLYMTSSGTGNQVTLILNNRNVYHWSSVQLTPGMTYIFNYEY